MTALATIDQLEAIGAALSRFGIAGPGISAYTQVAIDRQSDTLTATEADAIIAVLRGEVES